VIRRWLDRREARRQAEAAHVRWTLELGLRVGPDPFRPAPDGWLTAMAAEQAAWAGRGSGGAV
jgi:hypothetical protein